MRIVKHATILLLSAIAMAVLAWHLFAWETIYESQSGFGTVRLRGACSFPCWVAVEVPHWWGWAEIGRANACDSYIDKEGYRRDTKVIWISSTAVVRAQAPGCGMIEVAYDFSTGEVTDFEPYRVSVPTGQQ